MEVNIYKINIKNIPSGIHSITVKDSYGCNSPLTENYVLVINYPRFFTPNGDGFNDTWNIFDLKDQTNSRIYIFDRYGKLLKEIILDIRCLQPIIGSPLIMRNKVLPRNLNRIFH